MGNAPTFATFDQGIADAFMRASEKVGGLPGYLGASIVELTAGRLVARMEVRQDLLTPFGTLHGGVMAGLVDHALGCVLYPLMQRGQWAATTEIKLNYVAPVKAGVLETESTVLAMTNRSAVVRGEIFSGDRLVCAAQGTLTIVDPKPPA